MREDPAAITYFAETDFRNERKRFGIKAKDRLKHVYVIGKTGVGKSTVLENMIAQDILNGNGLAFLDPHGASAEKMLDYVPESRINDVIYFAPFDVGYPIAFNILEDPGPDKRHHAANGILSVMKKIWVDAFSGRMEYITQNVLLALLEYPDATLLGFNRVLTDKDYRKIIVDNLRDPSVRSFWIDEYATWDDKYRREAGAAVQNKIGQFTSNPIIRNIIGQPRSSFDLRKAMDSKKIILANFSKGLLGEQNAQLLGSLFSTSVYLAAMSRAEFTEEQMKDLPSFYLYADEFQNFANDSFADVLSEARKYKLGLTMAHQFVAQVPETVRDAIFGNVGTMIVFRIGPQDAEIFEQEFAPEFVQQDIINLGFAQIYLKLSVDGMTTRGFSATTLPPVKTPEVSVKEEVFHNSRRLYARRREDVEASVEEWFNPIPNKKQLEHQEYLVKKRAEVEATGAVWTDPSSLEKGEEQKTERVAGVFAAPQREYVERQPEKPTYGKKSSETKPVTGTKQWVPTTHIATPSSAPKKPTPTTHLPNKKDAFQNKPTVSLSPAPVVVEKSITHMVSESKASDRQERSTPTSSQTDLKTLLDNRNNVATIGVLKEIKEVKEFKNKKEEKKPESFIQNAQNKNKAPSVHSAHKDASKESLNALQEIIRRAKTEQEATPPPPLDSKTKDTYNNHDSAQTEAPSTPNIKEVPEDVLRQLLS